MYKAAPKEQRDKVQVVMPWLLKNEE